MTLADLLALRDTDPVAFDLLFDSLTERRVDSLSLEGIDVTREQMRKKIEAALDVLVAAQQTGKTSFTAAVQQAEMLAAVANALAASENPHNQTDMPTFHNPVYHTQVNPKSGKTERYYFANVPEDAKRFDRENRQPNRGTPPAPVRQEKVILPPDAPRSRPRMR